MKKFVFILGLAALSFPAGLQAALIFSFDGLSAVGAAEGTALSITVLAKVTNDVDLQGLQMIAEVGGTREGLRDYAEVVGRERQAERDQAAFDAGLFGVPAYLVDDEMWFGREHLPRVAWLLGGRVGRAPDVAYRSFAP